MWQIRKTNSVEEIDDEQRQRAIEEHRLVTVGDAGASLRLERGREPAEVLATPRVGIGYAAEPWRGKPWRLIDPSSPAVSGSRPALSGPRPRA